MEKIAAKKRGRPRSVESDDGPGSAVLSARIQSKTRKALEAAADREGRSISQVADLWLTEGAESRASIAAKLGGLGVARVTEQMIEVARRVQDEIGDPLTSSSAYHALSAAFDGLSEMIPTYSQAPIEAARSKYKAACALFAYQVEEAGGYGLAVNLDPIREAVSGRSTSTAATRRNVREVLNRILADGPETLAQAASELLEELDEYQGSLDTFVKEALTSRIVGHEMLRQTVARSEAVPAADILADLYRKLDRQDDPQKE